MYYYLSSSLNLKSVETHYGEKESSLSFNRYIKQYNPFHAVATSTNPTPQFEDEAEFT